MDTTEIPEKRPLYENDDTMAAEKKLAEWLRKKWRYPYSHKLPRSFVVDYAMCLVDLRIDRYVEIRTRDMRWDDFSDKYISVAKYIHCLSLSRRSQTPVFLALATTQDKRLGIWEIMPYDRNAGFYTTMDGRLPDTPKYRNDPADFEPILHVPNDQFAMMI